MTPAAAQAVAPGPLGQAGRYSVAAGSDYVLFADTRTGRVWFQDTGFVLTGNGPAKPDWHELPSPVVAPASR